MTVTLVDDGTLDTVFRCDACGAESRYSQEWRAGFFDPDSFGDNDSDGFAAMLAAAAEDHSEECSGLPDVCAGEARGDGYPGTRFFHEHPDCPGHSAYLEEI